MYTYSYGIIKWLKYRVLSIKSGVGIMNSEHEHIHEGHGHDHSIRSELMCHFPYAVFSVAFGLAVLSCMWFITGNAQAHDVRKASHLLFHSFHFMHIVFAATGAVITYLRFSKNIPKALLVGTGTASVFCTLSDAVLPYLGGTMLGVHMHFHLCFVSEMRNVLPFLFIGLLNGVVMSKHPSSSQAMYSTFSHFVHILVSSFASLFYLVSNGYIQWYHDIGIVFMFLIVAVVIPCTFSDVIVPMAFARAGKKHIHT